MMAPPTGPAVTPKSEGTVRVSPPTRLLLDWTEQQCASFRGVTSRQWLSDVANGLEPPPTTDHTTLIDPVEEGRIRLWNAAEVRAWKRPDEWFSADCGAHHGITASSWMGAVQRGSAPQPNRQVGRRYVWKIADVQAATLVIRPMPERRKNSRGSLPDSDAASWTADQCANWLGISPRAWRAAVQSGDAPPPFGHVKSRTPVWDPQSVRTWSEQQPMADRAAEA